MKTTIAKDQSRAEKRWVVVDAASQEPLGRMAVKIANLLRGRNRADYTPFLDTGDYVVVVNAAKLKVTGKKAQDKVYMTYSGYMGGEKYRRFEDLIQKDPAYIIKRAVWGMMPKNKLSHQMMSKLRIHAGAQHPYEAQVAGAAKARVAASA
jgi:large subunit ribosomal protein L13